MSSERRVLRYPVPVDDAWHRIEFVGDIVHVDCRNPRVVEFWTVPLHVGSSRAASVREFCVYGTGHPVVDPDELPAVVETGDYVGTALALDGAIVWHLFGREVSGEPKATNRGVG